MSTFPLDKRRYPVVKCLTRPNFPRRYVTPFVTVQRPLKRGFMTGEGRDDAGRSPEKEEEGKRCSISLTVQIC